MEGARGRLFCGQKCMLVGRPHAAPHRFGGRFSGRQESLGRRTAVIAGLSGALQVDTTKCVLSERACSTVTRRLVVMVILNVER